MGSVTATSPEIKSSKAATANGEDAIRSFSAPISPRKIPAGTTKRESFIYWWKAASEAQAVLTRSKTILLP